MRSTNENCAIIRERRPHASGFTLIELMVVVVIVGILASIAYPGYTRYVTKTRRSDAQVALTTAANLQERLFTECNWYASSISGARGCGANNTSGALGISADSPEGHYTIAVAAGAINASACSAYTCGYILTATPKASSPQQNDGRFRMDSAGSKQWDKNNNNTWESSENTWKN